jgi:hypothetical protein
VDVTDPHLMQELYLWVHDCLALLHQYCSIISCLPERSEMSSCYFHATGNLITSFGPIKMRATDIAASMCMSNLGCGTGPYMC